MVDVSIAGNKLVVTLDGWERIWALKSRIEVPMDKIERIVIDPDAARKPDGFKAPGTYWPGTIAAGTYRRRGSKSFWYVRNPAKAVIIDIRDSEFGRLVLEVANPQSTLAQIESAKHYIAGSY